ncbi:B3 domain-containing protein At5g60130-like [Impatiens glandulifera]|uniref:B3 domain-containing protein At5g60130-like n=1 Tax=Impatiens glandulifera TaxID=253017 RepID=UPI001FB19CCE|nr:B3 domain-containing protein At5g60130-like [Impatiens glandulifera]
MRIPSFFKVYTESTSSKSLQIPPAFVEELDGIVPKKPTLKNSKGRSWTVHTEKKGEDFFFMNGWSKFVSDILLEDGHVLVFDYDGDLCFEFMHFGHSKCEQKFVQPQSTMNDLENVEEDQDEDGEDDKGKGKEEEDDDDKDSDYEAGEDTDDSDYEYDDNDVEEEGDDETEEVQEEEKERLKKLKKTSLSITQKQKNKPVTRSSSRKAVVESNVGITVKGKTSSSIEIPEFESEDTIFKYGVVKRPENSYFVTRLRRDKPIELHLPAHIMKDYNINLTPSVMLVDQEKRRIYTKVVKRKDGRTVLTGGWKLFARFNNLVEEDRCICEFVKNHRAELSTIYLKMTVLRAGSWLPK